MGEPVAATYPTLLCCSKFLCMDMYRIQMATIMRVVMANNECTIMSLDIWPVKMRMEPYPCQTLHTPTRWRPNMQEERALHFGECVTHELIWGWHATGTRYDCMSTEWLVENVIQQHGQHDQEEIVLTKPVRVIKETKVHRVPSSRLPSPEYWGRSPKWAHWWREGWQGN